MRVLGLLSFYDEPVESLIACVAGLHLAGCDHLVAVDGAYALYPDGRAASHPNQHAALTMACRELGIGLTLHTPEDVWRGNETQKRTFLFALAWATAEPGDWFFVMDADHVVTEVPDDFKERLATTEADTAEISILDVLALRAQRADWPERFSMRCLFRAQPIRVETNHITYVSADGRLLWGWGGVTGLVDHLDLMDLVIEHHPDRRPRDRQHAKLCYYTARDASGIERGTCAGCGAEAVKLMPVNWRLTDIGPVADWQESCEDCARGLEQKSRYALRKLGVDPDRLVVESRNGRAPAAA